MELADIFNGSKGRMKFTAWPRWLIWLLKVTVVGAIFIVTSQLASQLSIAGTNVSALWLPAGVSLAAVLLLGYTIWPAFTVASALTTFFLIPEHAPGNVLIAVLFSAAADTLSPLLGAYLIRRAAGSQRTADSLSEIIAPLVWGGAISQAFYTTIGLSGACLVGITSWVNFGPLWLNWWIADLATILVITPFLLSWGRMPAPYAAKRHLLESLLVYTIVAASGILVFFPGLWTSTPGYFKYLTFPLVLWATFRLGFRGATLSTLIIAITAVLATLHDVGPFVSATPSENLLLVQVYIATLSLTTLIVASVLSQRQRAQAAQADGQQQLRAIFDSVNDAILVNDLASGAILDANPRVTELFGYTREEVIKLGIRDFCLDEPPYTYREAMHHFRKAAIEKPQLVEWRTRNKAGQAFWIEVNIRLASLGGKPRLVMAIRDITERKKVERALEESQRAMATLFSNLQGMAYRCHNDPSWTMSFVSQGCLELTGYAPEDLIGSKRIAYNDIICPEDQQRVRDEVAAGLAEKQPFRLSYQITAKGGKKKWVWEQGQGIFDATGAVSAIEGYISDVSELKQAEEALAHEQFLMDALMNNSPDALYFKDLNSRFIRISKMHIEKFGIADPKDAVGKSDFDFFDEDVARSFYESEQQIIRTGQPVIGEEAEERWPGRPSNWVSSTKLPLRDPQGKIVGTFGISRDITQRKQRERELESISIVSAALRKANNRAEMLPVILDQITELLNVDGAAIGMIDEGSGEVVFELTRGVFEQSRGIRLRPGQGEVGSVIASGQPYLDNDLKNHPGLVQTGWLKMVEALAVTPLTTQGIVLGVLAVGRNREIKPDEMRVLTSVADISANAIQRTSLHEQTERRLKHLTALRKIDIAINNSLDLKVTLEILLEQTLAQLHGDATDVLLLNQHLHTLEYAAGQGFRTQAIEAAQLQFGEGHAGRAAKERIIVSVPNLPELGKAFLRAGPLAGEGFITYHAVPLIAKGQVRGVLEVFHRTSFAADSEWLNYLETLAGQAAIAIDNATLFKELQKSNIELTQAFDSTLASLGKALALRDEDTEEHSYRSTELTLRLARAMGVEDEELVNIRRGAWLHDFGKIGVSDTILNKPGPLTPDEWKIMRRHPAYAHEMLSLIPFLRPALDIPFCHHEKWDGSGYPRGLKGEEIPMAARIFAVVDVWDALLSKRRYRDPWPRDEVITYIREQSGKHFDPCVADAFLKIVESENQDPAANQRSD